MSMAAVVVPALRLRRDTAGWSYRIPANMAILPGCLVIVPFRSRPTLGIVWELRDDDLAKESLAEVLTAQPLLLAPHRQLIEYLAEAGLCSLSTALFVWLPPWLKRLPLTRTVRQRLRGYAGGAQTHQQALMLPGRRPVQERQLSSSHSANLFAEGGEADWWSVLSGTGLLGFGRDGVLFAPWRNLRKLTVIDPEDVSYFREQAPYLSLVEVAGALAKAVRIAPQWRSQLPTAGAQALWGASAVGNDRLPLRTSHSDLGREPLLNDVLLSRIMETAGRGQYVLILHNAYDRLGEPGPDGRRKALPGVQSLSRQLARQLGVSELPETVVLGTRAILQRPYESVGLTVALNMDQLLETTLFADQLHGWSDLGHLFRYEADCLLQSHYPEHPLIASLLGGSWSEYVLRRIEGRRLSGLPPFCQQIVLSIKENATAAGALYSALLPLVREPWQISYPFAGVWRKQQYSHLMLTAPPDERLPAALRKALVAVPSPWKVQRNPWHVL